MDIKNKILSMTETEPGIIYLGQAGFLLAYGGKSALVDPYLSASADSKTGDGRWIRNYPVPYTAEELSFVDYVFMSHDHLDHADPETIRPLAGCSDAKFVCGAAIGEKVRSYGAEPLITMKDGETLDCGSFTVKILPAAHEEIHRNSDGDCEECGFLFDFGGVRVYHSGDSLVYDGLLGTVCGTDVMLLPVNGHGFFRRYVDDCIGNMDSYDAARLAQAAGARLMIPMHYDLYPGNSVPAEAVSAIISSTAPELDFRLPSPGKGWLISAADGDFRISDI